MSVSRNERSISLVDEHHGVGWNTFHDAGYLVGCKAIAGGVIGRSNEKHAWMYVACDSDNLINVVGKGVFQFVKGVHMGFAATFAGNAVVVPPREFGNQYGAVIALGEIIVDDILKDVLSTITQQYLRLRHSINLAKANRYDTLLALVVDAGIEAEILGVEVFYSINYLLRRFEIEFVAI